MPAALIVIGIVYGLALFLKALLTMGPAAPYFLAVCAVLVLACAIADKIDEKKKKNRKD